MTNSTQFVYYDTVKPHTVDYLPYTHPRTIDFYDDEIEDNLLDSNRLLLFGFNLSEFSTTAQFAICCIGVFLFYILYGYFQELLFQHESESYPWYYSSLQFLMSALLALYETWMFQRNHNKQPNNNNNTNKNKNAYISTANTEDPIRINMGDFVMVDKQGEHVQTSSTSLFARQTPFYEYIIMALILNVARGFGNESFKYMDYTTKVLFQSAKIIPVFVMGIFLFKRKYSILQYMSVILMVFGLFLFSLADATLYPQFSVLGIFYAITALLGEAAKSTYQEKLMRVYKASQVEVTLYSNICGFIFCFPFLIYSGEFFPALKFCNEQPRIYLIMIVLFFLGYVASVCMLSLIRISDSFITSVVSSARKLFTIVLSFILFQKPMILSHSISCIIFFVGMGLQLYLNKSKKSRQMYSKVVDKYL